MTKRFRLADIIWEAANNELWDGSMGWPRREKYSCCAVLSVIEKRMNWKGWGESGYDWAALEKLNYKKEKAQDFLKKLGCPITRVSRFYTSSDRVRQGRRYMWLLLAAQIAEEQDVWI